MRATPRTCPSMRLRRLSSSALVAVYPRVVSAMAIDDTPGGYMLSTGRMEDVLTKIGEGLGNAFLMAWEVWWALVLGFAISAIVQAWVPRERIEASLSGTGAGPLAKA